MPGVEGGEINKRIDTARADVMSNPMLAGVNNHAQTSARPASALSCL